MERSERLRALGFALALAGLFFAASSLVPGFIPKEQFPWPLLVGSFVYLNGAFLVMLGSRGGDSKLQMGRLRVIRLGFVAVFGLIVWRLFAP
jgi:hypothetical protein